MDSFVHWVMIIHFLTELSPETKYSFLVENKRVMFLYFSLFSDFLSFEAV